MKDSIERILTTSAGLSERGRLVKKKEKKKDATKWGQAQLLHQGSNFNCTDLG